MLKDSRSPSQNKDRAGVSPLLDGYGGWGVVNGNTFVKKFPLLDLINAQE
jgi:hypothetical protein